jgi:hypothetical protein
MSHQPLAGAAGKQENSLEIYPKLTLRIGGTSSGLKRLFSNPRLPCPSRSAIYTGYCMIPTLTWTPEGVRFIDQTKLPLEESYVLATTYEQVADAIVTMVVRGAPAIGVSAAYGIALGAKHTKAGRPPLSLRRSSSASARAWPHAAHGGESVLGHRPHEGLFRNLRAAAYPLAKSRSKSLPKPMPCMKKTLPPARPWAHSASAAAGGRRRADPLQRRRTGHLRLWNRLGVIRSAVEHGKRIHVYADETRPFLQGARLTAWELMADGIPTTVICDNMAASLMRAGPHPGRGGGCGPHRRQRRRRQQDRHLQRGHPRQGARHSVLRAPRPGPPSTWPRKPAMRFPSKSAPANRSHAPRRQATHSQRGRHLQSGLRRDSGEVRHRDLYRARRAARAVCRIAA